jgi:hypothetical protein
MGASASGDEVPMGAQIVKKEVILSFAGSANFSRSVLGCPFGWPNTSPFPFDNVSKVFVT